MADHRILPPLAGSAVPHAGSYRRVLPVSLERLYENALDWAHLPHVHASSFARIRCIDAGAWGWRAAVTGADGGEQTVELRLDRFCRRWITRAWSGDGPGVPITGPPPVTEIWTQAFPAAARRVDVVVDFFVPGVEPEARARAGEALARLYARLYDEDVAMMVERQRQLDRRIDRARDSERERDLGPRSELQLPQEFSLAGRDFVLAEVEGTLTAFPRQCPHLLGPLSGAGLEGAVVSCPWHGYRFDVRDGRNLSGHGCRLSHLPRVRVEEGRVRVTAAH